MADFNTYGQTLKLNEMQFTQNTEQEIDNDYNQQNLMNYFDQMNLQKPTTPLQRNTQSSHSLMRSRNRNRNLNNYNQTGNNFYNNSRTQINSQQSQRKGMGFSNQQQYNNQLYQNNVNYNTSNQPVQQLSHTQEAPKPLEGQLQSLKNKNSYGQYVDKAPLIKQNLLNPTLKNQDFARIFTPGVQSIQKQKNMNDLVSNRIVKINTFTPEIMNTFEQNVYTKKLVFDEDQNQQKQPLKTLKTLNTQSSLSTNHKKTHTLIEKFAKNMYQQEALERIGPTQYFDKNFENTSSRQRINQNNQFDENGNQIGEVQKYITFNNFNIKKKKVNLYKHNTKENNNNQLDKFKEIQNKINFKNVKEIRKVVVVEIYNLENIKRAINMKFGYIDIGKIVIQKQKISKNKTEEQLIKQAKQKQLQDFKKTVVQKLKLSTNRSIYLYLKDGTPVEDLEQLPYYEKTLLVGHCVTFKGIQNLFCSQAQVQRLNNIFDSLQDKIQDIINKEYRDMELENYKKDKNYESDYFKNGKFLTLQQIQEKKIQEKRKTSIFSKFAVEQQQENKNNLEKNDMDPYIGEQDISNYSNLQKYLVKVKRFLDLFFTKYDNEWRQEKQQTEIDIYVDSYQQYCKDTKQKFLMDEVLDKYEKRKQNQQDIKQQNCQRFFENVNKISASYMKGSRQEIYKQESLQILQDELQGQKSIKEEIMEDFQKKEIENTETIVLKQKELHVVYILYKALLDVASYIDSVEDIIKNGVNCQNFNFDLDVEYIKKEQQRMIEEDEFVEDEELEKVQTDLVNQLNEDYENCVINICDFENVINWNATIQIVQQMCATNANEKTQILMQVADEDRNGFLDKQEIEDLCFIVMDKMINQKYTDYKKELVVYFTDMFFSSLMEEGQKLQEVPMEDVKKAILKDREEADLLCFFCGASVDLLNISYQQQDKD